MNIKKVSLSLLLISVFFLPLLTFDFLLKRPMVVPAVLLWIISSFLLLANIINFRNRQQLGFHIGALIIAAYLIFEMAIDLTSAPFFRSLFGFARSPLTGVLTSVSLLAIYFTAVQFSIDDKARSTIFSTMLASMSVVGVLAVLQRFTALPFLDQSGRAYSTLTNPVELAGICLLVLGIAGIKNPPEPACLSQALAGRPPFGKGGETRDSHKVARGVVLTLISAAIVLSGSKIAAVLLVAYLLFFIVDSLRFRQYATAGLLVVVSLAGLVLYYLPAIQQYKGTGGFPVTQVSASAVRSSLGERKEIWETALMMWSKKPFSGWGQVTFADSYARTLKQRFGEETDKLIVFDVHNWVLDILAKGGLIKLAVVLFAIYWFVKNVSTGDAINKKIILSIAVYLVFLLFNPSYLISKVYFAVFLGLLAVKEKEQRKLVLDPCNRISQFLTYSAIVLTSGFLIFNLYFGRQRIMAESTGSKGLMAAYAGDYDRAIEYSKKAVRIFPYEPDYRQRLGWTYKTKYDGSKSRKDLLNALGAYKQSLIMVPGDETATKKIAEIKKAIRDKLK